MSRDKQQHEQVAMDVVDAVLGGATLKEVQGLRDEHMDGLYGFAFKFYEQGRLDDAEKFFHFLCIYDFYNSHYWMGLAAVHQLAATLAAGDEVRNDLIFDPGAWEKHANVLVAAIIALNVARVANAQLRGHFSVMASDAAKSQGAAIVESGKAAMYSAITAAVVSGAIAGFALLKNFQGQGLKQADVDLHKRNSLDAGTLERDLQQARTRDDWNPDTPYKVTTFDDFARLKTVDFKPQGSTLSAQEQAWFNREIIKAQNVGRTSDWLSQASGKGIEKRLEIGRALNAMSMSLSQVVTSMVRMGEHAAREKEVLQQSAQSVQKGLGDEVAQKDSADAALLQKLMEIAMQLFQSRIDVISKLA